MLTGGFYITQRSYKLITQMIRQIKGKIALQAQIDHIQLQVIVLQLVDDIEGIIIPPEIFGVAVLNLIFLFAELAMNVIRSFTG